MKTKIKTFVVKRSQWFRGKVDSALRVKSGKQCCLGFLTRQCTGCKAKDILGVEMPNNLPLEIYSKLLQLETGSWYRFAEINDRSWLTDREREKQLKELAKESGFRFKFIP
jgi:hypothetical protein